jgi:hypothetical protein
LLHVLFVNPFVVVVNSAANQKTIWCVFFDHRHNSARTMSTPNGPNTPSNLSFQSIPFTQATNDSISSVGLTSPVDVVTRTPQKASFLASGIPRTPEQVVVRVQNAADVNEEYDTDNEIGPFYDQVEDEGELEEEEEPLESVEVTLPTITLTTPTTPTVPPCSDPSTQVVQNVAESLVPQPIVEAITPDTSNTQTALLDINSLGQMKVAELKEALLKRGLSRNGNKQVLVNRLKDALTNNVPLVLNMTTEIRDNLAGDTFHGGAHWEIVPQDGEVIMDQNRDLIEGERLFDPTVPRVNYWEDSDNVGPPKRNYNATADRGVFIMKTKVPDSTKHGKTKYKQGEVVWIESNTDETLPNVSFLQKNNIDENSHPVEWLNLFIPWKKNTSNEGVFDIETITDHTNMRIACSTASHCRSNPIKPFSR